MKAGRGARVLEDGELAGLMLQIADGDRRALKALYNRTGSLVLSVCHRVLGRRDLAEEAMQDVFVAIWRSARRFDPAIGSAAGWIMTIARRRAVDRLRASPWLQREIPEFDETWQPALPADRSALKECLDRIEIQTRYAICLSYLWGLTHVELSRATGIPLGTIKSRIRRGLARLRECLTQ